VHEFAELAGVTVKALHHYDRLGLLKPRRNDAGYRVYSPADLERLEHSFVQWRLPLREYLRIVRSDHTSSHTARLQVIEVFSRSMLLLVAVARLINGQDDASSVRVREDALAKALTAKNRMGLSGLADKHFHVSWECGSVVRGFSTDMLQEQWISAVDHLSIDSYVAKISEVHFVRVLHPSKNSPGANSMADVNVDEFWIIRSPSGMRIEKHSLARDTWINSQGVWELAARSYRSHSCTDGPYWTPSR
jgi:DNA-binding transcriptional MerR regulator